MKRLSTLSILTALLACSLLSAKNESLVQEFSQGESINEKEAFKTIIASAKPVVVKFTMIHCEPCKNSEQSFRSMATEYKDKALFLKVDIYHYETIAAAYNIQYTPAWGIFVKGKLIGRILNGEFKLRELQTNLDAYLESHKTNNP